jgi:predicted Zn-dependent protease
MSKGKLTNTLVGGFSVVAGAVAGGLGQMAGALGGIGAGALLASYSRDNEREADALGMEYMVKAGYGPKGMVGLMEMLQSLSKSKPGTIELMFATHPMSDERYQNAVQNSRTKYASAQNLPLNRERYMDHTARLRAMKSTIEELQKGEQAMNGQKMGEAETHFRNALKQTPNDYTGLVMMATCQVIQKKPAEGLRYSEAAKSVYPQEAQAYYLSGFAKLQTRDFAGAYQDFSAYEKVLPGNPTTVFFKGFSREGMGNKEEAAKEYHRYLQVVQEGKFAQHAYGRMVEWGYYKR